MSERFVGDGRLLLSGRIDARGPGCHAIRRTHATRCYACESRLANGGFWRSSQQELTDLFERFS
jgi:hypothetical protein